MNPLRIQVNQTPETLSADNPWNTWQGDAEKAAGLWNTGMGSITIPLIPKFAAK